MRPSTDQAIRRQLLSDVIDAVDAEPRGVYGCRRVQAVLRMESDMVVNHKLWASIMAQLGIHGLRRQRSQRRNLVNMATIGDLINRGLVEIFHQQWGMSSGPCRSMIGASLIAKQRVFVNFLYADGKRYERKAPHVLI